MVRHFFVLYFICSLSLDLSILKWAFGKPSIVVSLWLVMKVMALSAFPLFMAWHTNRHSWLPIPDLVWLTFYIIYMTVFTILPVKEVCQQDLPPASSIIILAEQVRAVRNKPQSCKNSIEFVIPFELQNFWDRGWWEMEGWCVTRDWVTTHPWGVPPQCCESLHAIETRISFSLNL